ncbi:MAG: SDR family NAD(P)-dependent oxidoreductase [Haloferacaceae archaeon]
MSDRTLAGETAVVTGAARGIGRAIAERLAADGASVVVADVDAERGRATADGIRDGGGKAAFVETDVTDPEAVAAMLEATEERFEGLDVLVNNAGGSLDDDNLTRVSLEAWRRVLDLNLTGTFLCTREAVPRMAASGGGRLVHASSINALSGIGLTAYSAAKNGIVGLSRVVATQYGRHGVRSNVLCPGTVITEASSPKLTEEGHGDVREEWLDQYPLGRFGRPEDVAEAALFLASGRSRFVTGTELVVDGGLSAGPDQTLERTMYDVDSV